MKTRMQKERIQNKRGVERKEQDQGTIFSLLKSRPFKRLTFQKARLPQTHTSSIRRGNSMIIHINNIKAQPLAI